MMDAAQSYIHVRMFRILYLLYKCTYSAYLQYTLTEKKKYPTQYSFCRVLVSVYNIMRHYSCYLTPPSQPLQKTNPVSERIRRIYNTKHCTYHTLTQ